MSLERPKAELTPEEKLLLAENMLQKHFPEQGTLCDDDLCASIEDIGADFRKWFNSTEGKYILNDYVRKHLENEIVHFADMELLERLLAEYRDNALH